MAQVKDYAIYPESAWNYALAADAHEEITEQALGDVPFSKQVPPVVITWKGKRLASWGLEKNSAGTLPISPVKSQEKEENYMALREAQLRGECPHQRSEHQDGVKSARTHLNKDDGAISPCR